MNVIIFSKDRPSQLDLLLRSMKKFFIDWNKNKVYILYTYSNNEFGYGYEIAKSNHSDITYIKEKNFKNDLISLISDREEHTVFFVDDNVFKNKFSIEDKEFSYMKRDDVLCLSLRLHPNLNYCYPAAIKMNVPIMIDKNLFDWRRKDGDYGYPMSLDGHIFRTSDIKSRIVNLNYKNPNSLESNLAATPIPRPLMIMYEDSKIINIPVNRVQTFNNNIHGNIDAKTINDLYLKGKRISMDNIVGFKNISCHQEIELKIQ